MAVDGFVVAACDRCNFNWSARPGEVIGVKVKVSDFPDFSVFLVFPLACSRSLALSLITEVGFETKDEKVERQFRLEGEFDSLSLDLDGGCDENCGGDSASDSCLMSI